LSAHSCLLDEIAVACAFDLHILYGNDMRRRPFAERSSLCRKRSAVVVGAFNTLNLQKAMARECLLPFASLALRALSHSEWMRLIGLSLRGRGTKHQTGKRQQQRALSRDHSGGLFERTLGSFDTQIYESQNRVNLQVILRTSLISDLPAFAASIKV